MHTSNTEQKKPTQQDIINFVKDPETIKRAVEGSMDKRNKVLNSDTTQIDSKIDEILDNFTRKNTETYLDEDLAREQINKLLVEARIDELKTFKKSHDWNFLGNKTFDRRIAQLEAGFVGGLTNKEE